MHLTRKEHQPPHIHAVYGDYEALFAISDGHIIQGKFPNKGRALVEEFISKYRKELQEMWDNETYQKLPPIQ
ncbi:MAG: DUF4160 domain-containing protein [Bacilli bacterium]|nr:DUF4160 domain-containing protein [Bacilli bacterium]